MIPTRILRALALAAPLLLAGEARACSMSGVVLWRAPTLAHLIGTAMEDTVLAGSGRVRYQVAQGHSGPAGERVVYGQVVEAERIGGLAASRIPPGTRRVLLVPWDYGPDCTPTPWTQSARWVPPGERGVFHGVLRDSAGWVDGLPTLDVHSPATEPYPLRMGRAGGVHPDSMLSVEQLFEVMDLLPSMKEERVDAGAAAAPLLEWARAQPELAGRHPVAEMVGMAVHMAEHRMVRAISPPLAGTYRFTATLGEGPPMVFYARTRSRPTSAWNPFRRGRAPADPLVRKPEGYVLMLSAADSPGSLRRKCCGPPGVYDEAHVSLLRAPEPVPGPGGAQVWRGDVEAALVAQQFHADSAVRQFATDWQQRQYEAYLRGEPRDAGASFFQGQPAEAGARFFLLPDGSVRVEQAMDLGDGRRLVVRGERISRVTIPDPD